MIKNPKELYSPEKICHKCGKPFIPGAEHVFRDHGKWYCKWTCYSHRKDKVTLPSPSSTEEFVIPKVSPFTNKTKED